MFEALLTYSNKMYIQYVKILKKVGLNNYQKNKYP